MPDYIHLVKDALGIHEFRRQHDGTVRQADIAFYDEQAAHNAAAMAAWQGYTTRRADDAEGIAQARALLAKSSMSKKGANAR